MFFCAAVAAISASWNGMRWLAFADRSCSACRAVRTIPGVSGAWRKASSSRSRSSNSAWFWAV